MASEKKLTFEDAFERLVQIANELEAGEKSLAESVTLYEESVKLKKFCENFLEETKMKIKAVNESAGNSED